MVIEREKNKSEVVATLERNTKPTVPKTLLVRSSFAQELPEFDDHRLLTFMHDPISGLRSFIAIHRGGIIAPAFGATRFLHYENEAAAARDALRLARTMSYKSALAGLPYGGGKGVIMAPNKRITPAKKLEILVQYAKHLNYFRGSFITGTDVGVNQRELDVMHKQTPHLVGFRVSPEEYTAIGVIEAIKATLEALTGSDKIKGRSFAVQGLGKVGFRVASLLAKSGGVLCISDINTETVNLFKKHYPESKVVPPKDIHKAPVDMFVPCALFGVLNERTIPELDCSAVVGCANNQLSNQAVASKIVRRKILYVPDYVVNAGGLISVADEYGNEKMSKDGLHQHILKRVLRIRETVENIIAQAKKEKKTPLQIANATGEAIFNKIV
jgi:leucine dehydrogenase